MRRSPLSMERNGGTILLVFQAPGINEWKLGRPISSTERGSAGSRLAKAFQLVGKTRTNFDITNTVQCFPGKQEAEVSQRARDKPPLANARRHCSNWLRQDIDSDIYEKIVVFGSVAHKAVRELGYQDKPRFHWVRHPAGGLSNAQLLTAVS